MQAFRNDEKQTIKNGLLAAILDFISMTFVMGYSYVRTHIYFIFMVQLFAFLSTYVNTQAAILKLFAHKS